MDGWLFVRPGSSSAAANTIRPASYGATQAGAILRYYLAPESAHRPAAYARLTYSPSGLSGRSSGGANEGEAAMGLSARPLPQIPVSAHIEGRIRRSGGETEIRPAAFIVTEFAPVRLPLGITAESYAQAGYVGGDFATAFADGQVRAARDITRVRLGGDSRGNVRAGAGIWGGVQRGAGRLDIGPSASLDLRIAGTNARAQIDYRMQIAGDAEPGDGIAFTLSTGF